MPDSAPPGPGSEPVTPPPRHRIRWAVALVALLALAYLVGTFIEVWLASRASYEAVEPAAGAVRAAVVLGAAQYNGAPSPVLRARLDRAVELYRDGQVGLVVVTGGRQPTDATTEAKSGYDYLRERGLPDERLRLEVQGSSTYQSLAATARFLRRDGIGRVVLVTDRFHARRSELIAAEVGLEPVVALTSAPAPLSRLAQEALAVATGRMITFRRLQALQG